MDRAEGQMDALTLLHLAKIRDTLAQIERRAKDARQGEYNYGLGKRDSDVDQDG